MKYNNFMKKLAAVVTVVAMLASLGMTAFADVAVESKDAEKALNITAVDAVYTVGEGDVKTYTVTVYYEGAESTDQVTVLAYLFSKADEETWELSYPDADTDATQADEMLATAASAIVAVNQEAGSGSTEIKLSSAGTKAVEENETLIIKMGSDAAGIENARAVKISLADATEKKADLVVTANPEAVAAAVSYGAGKADLMGQLPDLVTVTGTRNGVQDNEGETVNVTWNVDESWVANDMGGMTVTGTIQEKAGVVLGDYTTATANVTVNALTTADVVAPAAIEVVVGDDAAAIAAKVKNVTVKSGEITDTYAVSAANVTGFDTAAEGSTTATIAISGKSANGIFDLAETTTTVSITVSVKPTFTYGDVTNDTKVNAQDSAYLSRHLAGWTGYETLPSELAADMNVDSKINAQDSAIIDRHLAGWTGYEVLPKTN